MMDKVVEVFNEYMHMASPNSIIIVIIGLIISLLMCFLGYRFAKIWLGVISFAVGIVLGTLLANKLFDNEILTLITAVVAGFFFAMLSTYIYMLGTVIECFIFGMCISAPHVFNLISDERVQWIIICSFGVLVAVICAIFLKPAIITITSLQGGVKTAEYLCLLLPITTTTWMLPVIGIVIAALGIAFQFLTTKDYKLNRSGDRVSKY